MSASVDQNALVRIQHIPVIQETLNQILSIIQSNNYAARFYASLENLAAVLIDRTKPIQQRLPFETVNAYANKSLDYFEGKFPQIKDIHAQDVVEAARKPADQAIELFQARLKGAQSSLTTVQDRLAGAVAKVRSPEEAQKTASELLNEMNKAKDALANQVHDLPANVQGTVKPLLDSLTTGINDVTAELARKDVPIANRAQNVLNYSKENAMPVIQQTVENLKNIVIKKKEQAEEKTQEVGDEAHKTYADVVAEN